MSLNKAHQQIDAKAFRLYKATKPHDAALPVTYTNATTEGHYGGHAMASPRADADNHLSIASRGLSPHVTRS